MNIQDGGMQTIFFETKCEIFYTKNDMKSLKDFETYTALPQPFHSPINPLFGNLVAIAKNVHIQELYTKFSVSVFLLAKTRI